VNLVIATPLEGELEEAGNAWLVVDDQDSFGVHGW
jgi:hypothetical protein